MLGDVYYTEADFTTLQAPTQPTGHGTQLRGKVKFDLGEITHPAFGTVHVSGEFPRICPKHKRENVTDEELAGAVAKLSHWVDKFFDRASNPAYFNELIEVTALFTLYINPFNEIESRDMELIMRTYFWLWHMDDVLEGAIDKEIPFKAMEQCYAQILRVFREEGPEAREYKEVPGCPGFEPIFRAVADLDESFEKHHLEKYRQTSGNFIFFLKRYVEAMRWFAVHPIDGTYSEETFKFWRRIIAFFDGIAEVVFMMYGLSLPKHIFESPSLRRILDINNSVGGFVNDLLGLKKELKYGQKDNFVVFKVLQKGVPIDQAVREVCDLLASEVKDYLLLRDALLKEFSYDEGLLKYVDILESLIDGHNRIYNHSRRHFSVGKVHLID